MKVILRQDVKGVGKSGTVAEVAEGYGRNFLLPRGLADEATPGNLVQIGQRKAAQDRRDAKALALANEIAARLEGQPVLVRAKSGEGGRLFGAVTNAQVADAIRAAFGIDLDRHKIELAEPIKSTGDHSCLVRVAAGVTARIMVRVENA